ncbi:2,3-diaminopropionate biosynthesis protein SbnB [Paenibacillus sp. 2TAB23]|uniref:2,3-diaminopropionate biosynthesis protein SbnB n=1 Tax=Paenibacillus sp. 2TAB23 TaxID=3233004 RepID=UPI003F992BCC
MLVLYLGDEHIRMIGLNWEALVDSMENAVRIIDSGDYKQPVKPYLRYHNPANRIIAMPAYVGGSVQTAGIKWIASFPGNLDAGLPRAHSITLLNDAATGVPRAMLNTPLPSAARTAAVSGLLLRHYLNAQGEDRRIKLGIIGFGPVGRLHYDMCCQIYKERIDKIYLFDIRECRVDSLDLDRVDTHLRELTQVAASWQQLYNECDVVITCTVSKERYINVSPKKGCLLLDVSLRDFHTAALSSVHAIVVDDWEEVCRENTDIELLHLQRGLTKEQTLTLSDVVCRHALKDVRSEEPVLFCPMGMAVFDLATAAYFVERANARGIGIQLQ